jgi:hypothetical protein
VPAMRYDVGRLSIAAVWRSIGIMTEFQTRPVDWIGT